MDTPLSTHYIRPPKAHRVGQDKITIGDHSRSRNSFWLNHLSSLEDVLATGCRITNLYPVDAAWLRSYKFADRTRRSSPRDSAHIAESLLLPLLPPLIEDGLKMTLKDRPGVLEVPFGVALAVARPANASSSRATIRCCSGSGGSGTGKRFKSSNLRLFIFAPSESAPMKSLYPLEVIKWNRYFGSSSLSGVSMPIKPPKA